MDNYMVNNPEFFLLLGFIEMPILIFSMRYILKNKGDLEKRYAEKNKSVYDKINYLSEKISDIQIETANKYVSFKYIQDLEKRITNYLTRIEKKIDTKK